MSSETKPVIYRKDYQQPAFWADKISLGFLIEPEATLVKSKVKYRKNSQLEYSNHEPLVLDGVDLELISVTIDGKPLTESEFEVTNTQLIIQNPPDEFELAIENKIYPHKNTALEGLYQSGDFFLTQCEAEGFRKISYFPDRPDVMAVFDVTLVADKSKYPILLSNGNQVSQGDLSNGRHYVTWSDPHPKPSYLFAIVAGDLEFVSDQFVTSEGKTVELKIFVEKENIDACQYAMDSLKRSMQWDQQRFGLVYDLDEYNIVATNDFNMGAMENKGLNIFNSKYVLAKDDTATDNDFIGVEAVIGHEYFHNWTGNRVTCRDWFQLSLKEGLTVFRDQEFTSDMQSRAVKRIEDVRYLRAAQFAEDAGPMSHPVRPDSFIEINNFYTLTIYEKGAEVVGMYRTLLGDDGFRKGMDLYFQRHDGQAVTCDDFRAAMSDANDKDLSQFEQWYVQNGTPRVEIKEKFDKQAKTYTLKIKQKQPSNVDKKSWKSMHIPMRLALFNGKGQQLALDESENYETVFELTEKKTKLTFPNMAEKPIASVFRNFSAPVVVSFQRDSAELMQLMTFDTDAFNRWDAAQTLASDVILSAYEAQRKEQEYKCSKPFVAALQSVLLDTESDPALLAEALHLPSVKSLMMQVNEVDIHALIQARDLVKAEIANSLEIEFLSIYNQNHSDEPYQVSSKDIAKRKLKNLCLSYLMMTDNPDIKRLCKQQYIHSNNMTDTIASLSLYVHHQADDWRELVVDFYEKWSNNALVLDKWFALQAQNPAESTLEEVRKLLEHEKFSLKNPNKVRSLIGAFASANLKQFHNLDGSGYEFLADRVIELNTINPQVASRMVSLFNNWKQFAKPYQKLMMKQITRISEVENLSSDVYEVVKKALAE